MKSPLNQKFVTRITRVRGIYFCAVTFAGCFGVFAADVDEAKLPPPAPGTIDFAHDIQPILENSCLRCHGPEKTKSKFRLDNRVAALKGGEKGIDILPGNSGKSPLIQYVAGLVEDMQMPPEGKGEPLTTAQVALLRAWIDQGAKWDGARTNNFAFSITPIIGATGVKGDANKFREHHWQKEGPNGGVEDFQSFEQAGPDTSYQLSGHALLNDYKITLEVEWNELGFVHAGWEQYRKYFDDIGGYYPTPTDPSTFALGRDLHLDIGKAWIDFGLTLPDWPRLVLGYEYDYKQGDESETSWGSAGSGAQPNIGPVSRSLNEGVHILKFDLDHELYGITIEERFRGEFYRLDEEYQQVDSRSTVTENVAEGTTYFQGANTLRLEKKFSDWCLGSAGYLYSKLNSEANFTDAFNIGTTAVAPNISLERESHVFNLNGLFGPFNGLTISTGVQNEWTRERGFGSGAFTGINTAAPFAVVPIVPASLSSDYDQSSVSENVALRYTKIPWTVLFAEGRFEQERIGQTEFDDQPGNGGGNYLQSTDFGNQTTDMRVGFTTSPWQKVSLSAHYRRYEDDSRYNTDATYSPAAGYPGFLQSRDLLTDEFETKLVLHPISWLKTTLSYQYQTTDYHDATAPIAGISPGGDIQSGESNTKIYSINAVVTPWRRLFLSSTFSYQPQVSITADNNFAAIAPYRGDIYSVLANATYVLNEKTDLSVNYSFSEADFGQNNFADGLPVGMEYQMHSVQVGLTRRISKNISAKLLYAFNKYNEPSSGNALDYEAHTIFASLTFRLP